MTSFFLIYSNGVGRTGAYIAIDLVSKAISTNNKIDILGVISQMRRWRPHMVTNVTQLQTIYETVTTALICGQTAFPTSEIHSTIRKLGETSATKLTGFENELKVGY